MEMISKSSLRDRASEYSLSDSDDVCEWKRRTDDNFLHTSCNNRAGAYSDEFKYCPYCGKKIKMEGYKNGKDI